MKLTKKQKELLNDIYSAGRNYAIDSLNSDTELVYLFKLGLIATIYNNQFKNYILVHLTQAGAQALFGSVKFYN